MTRISESQATRDIVDVLDRVRKDREHFEILSQGSVFARIEPCDDKPLISGRQFFRWFTARRWLKEDDSIEFEKQLQDIRKGSAWSERQWD